MTRVTLGKSRVREIRLPGSVRAKAKWLSYSTTTQPGEQNMYSHQLDWLSGPVIKAVVHCAACKHWDRAVSASLGGPS